MSEVVGTTGDDVLNGTSSDDVLRGLEGNDILNGRSGFDELRGGAGDDVYFLEDNVPDEVIELAGEGRDTVYVAFNYTLASGQEVEILSTISNGATTAINLTGNSFNNTLVGNAGANVLNGAGGNDALQGLGGNDTYFVDSSGDLVVEAAGGGTDIVYASASYTLAAGQEIENLAAISAAATTAINLTGNNFNNTLVGNAGANVLNGGTGNDAMQGLGGNDTYFVDSASDHVFETAGGGNDTVFTSLSFTLAAGQEIENLAAISASATTAINLTGNSFNNTLVGNAGANVLNGGGGNDTLQGLGGNDTYLVDSDTVIEAAGGGTDIVYTSASYTLAAGQEIENLAAISAAATTAINLTGNEYNNQLIGNAGANVLNGGTGNDALQGLGGNDTYFVDSASDHVFETAGGGTDIVYAGASYTLAAGQEIENLAAISAAATTAINLTGNNFNNTLVGNAGANVLNGGTGNDAMQGLGGNDTYFVDSASDHVFETAGGGSDTVFTSLTYTLAAGQEIENLAAVSAAATTPINLTGNNFNNTLVGNAGANVLNGGGGNDTLQGLGGNDQFLLNAPLTSANVVTITDFQPGIDRLVLAGGPGQPFAALATGGLDSRSFVIGTAAAGPEDFIIYNSSTGALLYDADGNGAGAAVQFATLQTGLSLSAADFLVSGPANHAPTISSAGAASVAENSPASTIVYQVVASDADGDRISYSLAGADAGFFSIDSTGAVRLLSPADFETRAAYSFTVNAADSSGSASNRAVVLNVTDVDEGPSRGPTPIINETTAVNNTTTEAQPIDRGVLQPSTNALLFDDSLPSATIKGAISAAGDIDVYSITLSKGEKLILDIDNSGGDLDSVVRVYNGSGTLLGYVDDARIDPGSPADHNDGTGYDSFVTFRAPSDGTYYFSVESWGDGVADGPGSGTTTGSYDLNVSIGPLGTPAQILEEDIEALIDSQGWSDPDPNRPGTNLTYSFPNSPSDYAAGIHEATNNFEPFNAVQQSATTQMLAQISTFANLTFDLLPDPQDSGATIRYAMSDDPDVAYAYLPGSGPISGTAWFRNSPIEGDTTPTFDNPRPATYEWMSIIHETGHTLGLKHGHEFPAVSFDHDTVEYTVMTYRSHVGQPPNGYTNETFGFPTTPMALDIAALQRLYGANFNFNSGDSVYSWSPTTGQMSVNGVGGLMPGGNRVFLTIWDGGGNDTYDMSNYSNAVRIDLRPGEYSMTSQVQLANLGQGFIAHGNVLNAYLYNDDPRSLIENAIGGVGGDTLIANQAANHLTGGAGADTFRWFSGQDAGLGGQADVVTDFLRGTDKLDLSQIDAIRGTAADDSFTFIGASAFHNVAGELRFQVEGDSVRIQGDLDGNGVADMEIVVNHVTSLDATNFLF